MQCLLVDGIALLALIGLCFVNLIVFRFFKGASTQSSNASFTDNSS